MVELEEPDKGQAWVVAIAACIINMILSGISRMVGLLYVAVISAYGVSRRDATLPFTVRNSIRCLSGPLVGVIGQRYGIRAVTFCGGVIASVGAALCCIAPNTVWLTVFWGGIHGLGFALANTLFQVVVNQYFQKYRATASGIALSGACVGSFVFPAMIEAILQNYGLSGGFLILGGIVMNVLPPSLLLKPPPWVEHRVQYARLKALKSKQESVETLNIDIPETPPEENSIMELRSIVRTSSLSNCPVEEVYAASRSLGSSTDNLARYFGNAKGKYKINVICTLYKISESPPLNRRNSSRDNISVSLNNRQASYIPTISRDINANQNVLKSLSAVQEEVPPITEQKQPTMWESVKGIAVLFTIPVYIMISLCMSTYVIIFIPILTVIVDYGKDKGIPEYEGKYLINAMAMGDLIGRLCFGWVTDKGFIPVPIFMMLSLILQGVSVSVFPFAKSLYSFMLLLFLYGITSGTILVHFPLLVLKYVDVSQQSVGMGCVGFLSGITSFGIPPMIGYFRDIVGSYDGMFYLTGGISVLSGCMWLLEPLVARIQHKNMKEGSIKNKIAEQQHIKHSKEGEAILSFNGHKPS